MQYAAICSVAFVFFAICLEIGHSKEEIDSKILRQTPVPCIADVPHGDLMLHLWTIVFLISIITSASNTVSEIQYMFSAEAISMIEYAQHEAAGATAFATLCLYISYFLVAVQYKFMFRIMVVARLYRKWNYAHSAYPREFSSLFLSAYSIGALSQGFSLLFVASFYYGIGYTETLSQEIATHIGRIIAIMFWGIVFHLYWKNLDKRYKNMQQIDSEPRKTIDKPSKPQKRKKIDYNCDYQLYQTHTLKVKYDMNRWLNAALASKHLSDNSGVFAGFEAFVEASEFYSHFFAHLLVAISLFFGRTSWQAILISLVVGYVFGIILSQCSTFILYNCILNFVMIAYNFIQVYFIIDMILFVVYGIVIDTWWLIPIHVVSFFLLQNICGIITIKSRRNTINRLALHFMPELQYANDETLEPQEPEKPQRTPPRIEEFTQDQPEVDSTKEDPLAKDKARFDIIKTEIQKIPVQKVKQWYADGKITEDQYRSIARKYNTLRKEMKEIQERIELLQNINE